MIASLVPATGTSGILIAVAFIHYEKVQLIFCLFPRQLEIAE